MHNIEINIFKNFSDELSKLWLTLESKSENYFFQSFKWQELWFNHQIKYKKRIDNYTVVVSKNNIVIMILPFHIDYKNIVRILKWSGFPFSDYNAPLLKNNYIINKEDFLYIWEKIKNNNDFDCISFDNQPEQIINLPNPFFKFLDIKKNNYYCGIKYIKKFDIKKKEYANIKYQTNRLKKLGKLEFKTAKNLEDVNKVIKFIILHKSDQYRRTNAWNLFNVSIHKKLFELLNLNLNENIDISYLLLNDEIIAAQSGYKYKKRYYYLFPAYKYEYRKYSPGKILLQKLIIEYESKLFDFFDLTIGSETYKESFSNYRINSAFFLQSINLKGFIYTFFLKLKFLIKIIYKKL